MKVAIISDIHNNIVNLDKTINYCKVNGVEKIICCGDLSSKETLDFFCDHFNKEIYYVFGNMDDAYLKAEVFGGKKKKKVIYKNAEIFKSIGNLKIKNKNVFFTHFPNIAKKICQNNDCGFVFYGHTHKPWEEKNGNCKILNPGNIANEIYPPSFAIWDVDKDDFLLVKINELN